MIHTSAMMLARPLPAILPAALVLALAAQAVSGCRKDRAHAPREVDYSLVRIEDAKMHLRHDRVGHGKWESEATFVLVDAVNTHTDDLLITLAGELVDAGGQAIGELATDSLRVPAGGVRTFALIDKERKPRPGAASARVRVVGAYAPDYPPPVQITDGHVYRDGDRVVVTGMVRNTIERPVRVIVIAGFYDQNDKPLRRPFSEMYVLENDAQPAQFVGPPGSVKGYLFVGDFVY